jgi:hypothetical protein
MPTVLDSKYKLDFLVEKIPLPVAFHGSRRYLTSGVILFDYFNPKISASRKILLSVLVQKPSENWKNRRSSCREVFVSVTMMISTRLESMTRLLLFIS